MNSHCIKSATLEISVPTCIRYPPLIDHETTNQYVLVHSITNKIRNFYLPKLGIELSCD